MPIVLSKKAGGSGGGGAPSGPAGGSLAGTYPNPTIAPDAVGTTEIDDGSVTAAKLATGISPTTLLFSSVLGGDAAAIDSGAGGFSTSFDHLLIVANLRSTQAATVSVANLTFNNDTGANYDRNVIRLTNATVSGNVALAAAAITLQYSGANAQAGANSPIIIWVPCYSLTTFHKTVSFETSYVEDTAADTGMERGGGRWRSTAAISRVALTAATGNLLAGSSMWIYAF